MPKAKHKSPAPSIRPRFRIVCGSDVALGPGKVELLELIRHTGSIREAAQRMGMSYMRAWMLIRTMNRCFKRPLVTAVRGGSHGGGAQLTETGQAALTLYQRMESESLEATQASREQITRLLL